MGWKLRYSILAAAISSCAINLRTVPRLKQSQLVLLQKHNFALKQDSKCTYIRNVVARPRYHFCRVKVISITYSQCMSVALDIQHAKRMRRLILHLYFSTLYHKRHGLRTKTLLNKKCVWIFSANFVWNISQSNKKNFAPYHTWT
jgi:hypothetical protein